MSEPRRFKALITDLDGTAILNYPEGMPSAAVIKAIEKVQKNFIVSVATGRMYSMCREILKSLNIQHPCVVEGGSQIIEPETGKILWEQSLSPELMTQIQKACLPHIFHEDGDDAQAIIPDQPSFKGTKYMMVILALDEAEAIRLVRKLKQIPEVNALKVKSWVNGKWDLHISHLGASKRHALEVLLGMLQLDAAEVIGVGDSHNDLPLFEAVGFKVAMGNAVQDLKDQADYIAPTVGEDGLAEVIEKYVL